jgi:hypothetical protein
MKISVSTLILIKNEAHNLPRYLNAGAAVNLLEALRLDDRLKQGITL